MPIRPAPILLCLAGALAASEAPPPHAGPDGAGGKGPQGPGIEELLKTADANNDGKVTKEELAAALERPRRNEREKMFSTIDANGDGAISKEEFLAFEPPAPPGQDGKEPRRRGPDVDEMFKRLDRNGDGAITKDELPRRPGKDFFEEADANHDGQLSKEEIQAARERMTQEHGERREPGEKEP